MSDISLNAASTSYAVLKHKSLPMVPPSITCFALNYVTHRLLLCNKDRVIIYDLINNQILRKFNYAKELSKAYDNEIEIRSADAIILSNLWITLINKKSFLFFNDKLEFTRIYSPSPNPLLSIQVLQRTNDLLTIREDRKAVKVWKFEVIDSLTSEKKIMERQPDPENRPDKDKKKPPNMNSARDKPEGKDDKDADRQEKQRKLKELGLSFEVNVFMRKQLHIPQNRSIVKMAFSEELKIVAIALDSMEVVVFNTISGDHVQTLNFLGPNDKEVNLTSHVSIDQEILYYCDERRMVMYDLILNQEIANQQCAFTYKIASFHAERANSNGGVYVLTSDEKIHAYSFALKKILWSEDLGGDGQAQGILATDSTSRGFKTSLTFNLEAKNAMESNETSRRENVSKDSFFKSRYKMATDLGAKGLTTLFVCKPGALYVFDAMSSGKVVFNSTAPIKKMDISYHANEQKSSTSKTELDEGVLVRLEFADYTTSDYSLKTFMRTSKKLPQNLITLWKQSAYEHNPNNEPAEELKAAPVLEVHTMLEEKLFVVITQTYVHIVSLRTNRMLSQSMTISEITACLAICLSFETFGNYYVILGTKKGTIVILECDFTLRTVNILKHMPKHNGVLALRHLKETNHLLSVGTEGDIFLYTFTKPNEPNVFPTQQFHRLIWNQVTNIAFLSDKEILAGLDNGAIQYAKFSWKTETSIDSRLFEYHTSAIRQIVVPPETEGMFIACCEDNVVTCWQLGEPNPLKIFRLADTIVSIFTSKNPLRDQIELYVALENMVIRLEYDHGSSANPISKEEESEWNEGLFYRTRYCARAIREGKTANPALQKMIEGLEEYKKSQKELSIYDMPMLNKFLYQNTRYNSLKSLEVDQIQYVNTAAQTRRSQMPTLDLMLSGFYQRKIVGEPLISKTDIKVEKKAEKPGSLASLLVTTLKKYPTIKNMMIEKQKAKELEEMHKNVVLLLNITYKGEDDLEQQYKFLEENYQMKRNTLDEAYFRRAKILFYKKPANNAPRFDMTASSQDFQFQTPRKEKASMTATKSGFKLPYLEAEKKYQSPEAASVTERSKTNKQPKVQVPKIKHFKNYSEDLEKEMMKQTPSTLETIRGLTKQNEFVHRPLAESGYQSYSASKGGPSTLKLNINFSFSPSPRLPSVLTSLTTRHQPSEDKLSIGQDQGDSTVRSPFFVTNRADLNRDAYIIEYKSHKSSSIPNIMSPFNSTFNGEIPKRPVKDFVGLHSKGFQAKENVDMFNHVLRLLLKNHYLLKLKSNGRRTRENSSSPKPRQESTKISDESDMEYVPIEIKQYILEINQREMDILDDVVSMYEMHTGQKINAEQSNGYSSEKLEEEMERENTLLEQILQQINEHGIESIGLNQMIKFKQVMKRRVETFSHLQAYIEVSGLLRTQPVSPRDVKLKDELMKTFHKVKDIADLRTACFPAQLSPKLKTSASMASGTVIAGTNSPWAQGGVGIREARTMLDSIRRSMENVAALDGSSSAFDRRLTMQTGSTSARNLDSLRNIELTSPRGGDEGFSGFARKNVGKAFTTVTRGLQAVRSWNELLNGMKESNVRPVFSGNKLKRRNSLSGGTNEIRMIYKTLKKFEEEKPGTGSPKNRSIRTASRGEERMTRIDTVLGLDQLKGRKMLNEEEDMKKIEKAWKEKDFGYLRDFLSQKNSVVMGDGKKDSENVVETTEGNEAKGANKRKKKKRNPNINASSGSVVTTTGAKAKKTEDDMMGKVKDGYYDGMKDYQIREKEEDEEEDGARTKIPEGPLAAKRLQLLNQPTKESMSKALKYQFQHSLDTNQAEQGETEVLGDVKVSSTVNQAVSLQGTVTSIKEKVPSLGSNVKQNAAEKDKVFQVFNRGNVLKIHKRNDSAFSKEKLIDNIVQSSRNPEAVQKPANKKHKPALKSKYDLGEIEIDAFTVGEETKTITFGLRTEDGSVTNRTKETEEVPLSEDRPRVMKEDSKKKVVEITEKTEMSKTESRATESDFEGQKRKKISFAESVRKSRLDEGQEVKTEKSEDDGKKKGKLQKLGTKYRGASFANHSSKKVQLLVKGEERNRLSGDGTGKESGSPGTNVTPKARVSNFAPGDGNARRNKQKMSRFAAEKEAAKNKEDISDDEEDEDYEDHSGGRSSMSPESALQAYTDLKIGSDEGKMNDEVNTLKDNKSKADIPESQMPSIAEKLDKSAVKLPKQRSKRSMKKKVTAGGPKQANIPTEENKESASKEEKDIVDESTNRIEDAASEDVGEVKPGKKARRHVNPEEEDDDDDSGFRQKTLRHSLKPRSLEKEEIEDILENPLKLFQVVMNAAEVDQETKLDLFFYGNRKEALKEFVKEVEDAIEHNIIKNNECNDQLAEFFDYKMNNLLAAKPTQVYHPLSDGGGFNRKHTFPYQSQNNNAQGNYDYDDTPQSYMKYRSSLENEAENSRRIAFQYQQTLLNNLKASASSTCSLMSQANMGPKSPMKQGQIILSPIAFETLVQHKDEILLDPNWNHHRDDDSNGGKTRRLNKEEQEEVNLLERMKRIRRILTEIREGDPEEFERLMLLFGENKKLYNLVMREVDAKEKIKINILHEA